MSKKVEKWRLDVCAECHTLVGYTHDEDGKKITWCSNCKKYYPKETIVIAERVTHGH